MKTRVEAVVDGEADKVMVVSLECKKGVSVVSGRY